MMFQERVVSRRQAEYNRLRAEREERLSQILRARREERDIKRKMLYFLRTEEERLTRLREEEEARKRQGKKMVVIWVMSDKSTRQSCNHLLFQKAFGSVFKVALSLLKGQLKVFLKMLNYYPKPKVLSTRLF